MSNLVNCKTCGKEVSKGANNCPHCGEKLKVGVMKKAGMGCGGFIVLIILLSIIGSCMSNKSTNPNTQNAEQPKVQQKIGDPDQVVFEQKMKEFQEKYRKADGEMQKSAVYREQAGFIREYFPNFTIANYEGKIDKIGTTEGGKFAYVEIDGKNNVTYATWNNQLSDINDKTMLALDSKVYKELSTLKEGDAVVFSGSLIPDNDRGCKEASVTESGYVTSPKFLVKFTEIKKK